MRGKRTNVAIGLLFPSFYVALGLMVDVVAGPRIFWRPPASYLHLLLLVALPIGLLCFRHHRLLAASLLVGAAFALALLFYAEPIRYRFEWRHRSAAYVSDLLDAAPGTVKCRFTESTRISLACEVMLSPGQLEQLSQLSGLGMGRFGSCAMTKGDPCGQISGYCDGAGQQRAGVEVYDISQGPNRDIIERNRDKLSPVLMLENLYLDRKNGKACIIINTGGSDQLRC